MSTVLKKQTTSDIGCHTYIVIPNVSGKCHRLQYGLISELFINACNKTDPCVKGGEELCPVSEFS